MLTIIFIKTYCCIIFTFQTFSVKMAGKKKGPTKAVAKNMTKTVIDADVPNNTAILKECV